MEEKNELNDIILNKSGSSAGNKKIILAVATLGVILIVVVMLMNTLASNGTDNLPQAVLPPEPQKQSVTQSDEPLFEDVDVIQESAQENRSLDEIAQKLKEESTKESIKEVEQEVVATPQSAPKAVETKKKATAQPKTTASSTTGEFYVQVGSFAKYEPNKKFLDSILSLGYKYKFHKVTVNSKTLNKVLVGPFHSEAEARKALIPIRNSVEAGAFLTKI
ncbi:MAG: SPOR domain-containing protein [Sulfurimonas sp.]|uniref:SPOR domain-containing protein n=1 Tax=Sulfurimonas sp. TaxID=2022749 RepID=UPI0025D83B7F|nr:SPOR domain-containing protein [Sulfurimonas sp.]MCK9454194.1 SPOR domain-containing protein [Sulfurimonas sp.]